MRHVSVGDDHWYTGQVITHHVLRDMSVMTCDVRAVAIGDDHWHTRWQVITLNILYDIFDDICTRTGVYKVPPPSV